MPATPARIFAQLGVTEPALMTWESVQKFGGLKPGTKVQKGAALFPRVDVRKELEALGGGTDKAEKKPEAKPEKKGREKGRGAGRRHRIVRRLPQDQAGRREGRGL